MPHFQISRSVVPIVLVALNFFSCANRSSAEFLTFGDECRNQSETRFALVIGFSYDNGIQITGREDARLMADHLCQMGFAVKDRLLEGDKEAMISALFRFRQETEAAQDTLKDIVFFYSGHGFQFGNDSYLLPEDTTIDLERPQVPLSLVFRALKGAPNARKIILLDACRDSRALPTDDDRSLGDVSEYQEGMSRPAFPPSNSLISYSANFNSFANSGPTPEDLSPYSEALLDSIREPGLALGDLLQRIALELRPRSQVPVIAGPGLDKVFFFKEALDLKITIKQASDDLLVLQNGSLAFTASNLSLPGGKGFRETEPLRLKGGRTELLFFVSNGLAFKSGQSWRIPKGWGYEIEVDWPDRLNNPETVCIDSEPDACTLGAEESVPFKSGPRHGKVFQVASVHIQVDPGLWNVDVTTDLEIWEATGGVATGEQSRLWCANLNDSEKLPLEKSAYLLNLTRFLSLAEGLMDIVGLSNEIDIPDLSHIQAHVWGIEAFEKWADICMTDRIAERIQDLEVSIRAALEDTEVVKRPFDSFDASLSECIWEEIQKDESSLFRREDVLVWTALEQDEGGCDAQR